MKQPKELETTIESTRKARKKNINKTIVNISREMLQENNFLRHFSQLIKQTNVRRVSEKFVKIVKY